MNPRAKNDERYSSSASVSADVAAVPISPLSNAAVSLCRALRSVNMGRLENIPVVVSVGYVAVCFRCSEELFRIFAIVLKLNFNRKLSTKSAELPSQYANVPCCCRVLPVLLCSSSLRLPEASTFRFLRNFET